jgi:hypothetical protein
VCFVGKTRSYKESEEATVDAQRATFINSHCKSIKPHCPIKTTREDKPGSQGKTTLVDMASCNTDTSDAQSPAKRIKHDTTTDSLATDSAGWSSNFQPRASREISRNSQFVSKQVKKFIVQTVFSKVLEADTSVIKLKDSCKTWRKGGNYSKTKFGFV